VQSMRGCFAASPLQQYKTILHEGVGVDADLLSVRRELRDVAGGSPFNKRDPESLSTGEDRAPALTIPRDFH
jgi:hypothetical protein